LETGPYQALTDTLQVLLATRPTLALVMLVGEAPDGASAEALRTVKTSVDDVEQLLLACFRRSDKVVRCGDAGCAAILMDAEVEGALRAVHRFQRMLGCWPPLAVALRVGVAAAPGQADESRALLTQALQPRFRILPAQGAEQETLPKMDELVPSKPALLSEAPKVSAAQERASKTTTNHLRQMLATATAAALSSESGHRLLSGTGATPPVETLTKARARALGVPYIAPPQRIPSSVRNLLPAEVMHQLHCLPIGRDRRGLTVALADPTDRGVLQRLEQMTGLTIFPVMTDPDALEALAPPVRARRASHVASQS
jgi:hypothetical protein